MTDQVSKTFLQDYGETTTWKDTPEGFLRVNANFSRAGVQEYFAGELNRDALPEKFRDSQTAKIRLLRPVDEVFKPESLATYSEKPVTNHHPPNFIDSTNYSKFQVGMTVGSVKAVDTMVNGDVLIQDVKTIEAVKGGMREVSAGYGLDIDWTPGNDPVHGAYDGKQTNIAVNHIAILHKGRAGSAVRINDSWKSKTEPRKGATIMEGTIKVIDGISVEFSAQGAEAVDKLQDSLKVETAKGEKFAVKLADKQKEVDELQGKLDVSESNKLTDAQIEALVTERMTLVDRAKSLYPEIDCRGKIPVEIKKEVITKLKDGFDLTGKSDEYIGAVFDVLEPPKGQVAAKMAAAISDAQPAGATASFDVGAAAAAMHKTMSANAWKDGK